MIPQDPPIGAIVRQLELSLPEDARNVPTPEQAEAIHAAYLDFDTRYQDRPDYRLWRMALHPYFAYTRFALAGAPTPLFESWDLADTSVACTTSHDPLVFWSTVALAPEIIKGAFGGAIYDPDAPIWEFADRLWRRLRERPRPLDICPGSCGIAAVLFLIRYENLLYKAGNDLSVDGCEELLGEIRHWCAYADPSWSPGRKLDMDDVRREREGPTRLRASHSTHEYTILSKTLDVLAPTISLSVHELTPRTEALLSEAYRYGLTAWLTARSRRIDEMLFETGRGAFDSKRASSRLRRAFLIEFRSHLKLGNAARNAGEYLEAGKHLYLMYRLIPDRFRRLPEVEKELKRRGLARFLKEVGLEVDRRFATDQENPYLKWRTQQRHDKAARIWREAKEGPRSNEVPPATGDPGFSLRVHEDMKADPLWLVLREEIPPSRLDRTAVGYLRTIVGGLADCGFEATPEALAAAYQLSLRYGYVRSAGKILARGIRGGEFEVTPMLLLDFVHTVKRCTQLDPFGMRQELIGEWQSLIREACEQLLDRHGPEWMSGRDRLWIHETLVNRTHVQHKYLSTSNARRLFEKSIGTYDIQGLREFYDLYYDFNRRAPGIANLETLAERLEEYGETALGVPVAVSLMRMGRSLSIVAVGRDGVVVTADCVEPGLDEAVAAVAAEAEHWFKVQDLEASRQIGWRGSLRRIAARICALAERCDPSSQVLLVSMEPSLAHLPWQHLIAGEENAPQRLVSIIPSLSAFTWRDHGPATETRPRLVLSSEPGEEIDKIVGAVLETTWGVDLEAADVCIVAGHGLPPQEGELPAVRIRTDLVIRTFDQWLELLGSRVTVLHCCHSGTPAPLFMEEFGGVAGLGICLGTKTFLAPVSEVAADTAATLQRNLFAFPGEEIGVSYLNAIREDPGCCLYNLYGSPYERIVNAERAGRHAEAQLELQR